MEQLKNRITTSKKTRTYEPVLAARPTMLHVDWTVINDDAIEFSEFLLSQFYEEKRQRKRAEVAVYMHMLVANLYFTNEHGLQLLFSRDTSRTSKALIQVIDWLTATGWINTVIAPLDKEGGCTSWMYPTDKFTYAIAEIEVILGLRKGYSFVELRGFPKKKGQKKPIIEVNKRRDLGQGVILHNQLMLNQHLTLRGKRLSGFLKRVFNNESYELGGRFYGCLQTLSKEDRARILIGGEAVCEPDFSRLHPHLLYAMLGKQLSHDPYEIEGYPVKLVKKIFFTLINADSRKKFIANIDKSGKADLIKENQSHTIKMTYYHEQMLQYRKGLLSELPVLPKRRNQLKGFIEGIPEGTCGEHLMQSIEKTNSSIAHLFCTPGLGLKLQYIDGNITDRILRQTAKAGIIVYPVHDSYICKQSDLTRVIEIMHESYERITSGFSVGLKAEIAVD